MAVSSAWPAMSKASSPVAACNCLLVLEFNMRRALDAATLPPLVAGLEVERASCDGGCNMRQPPAPSDSRRSVAPPPGMGEGAPTARPSLPAAAPLLSLVSVSVSARPESRAEALMESRAEALSERVKESRRTRGDMGARDCGVERKCQRNIKLSVTHCRAAVPAPGRKTCDALQVGYKATVYVS